jgi:integrase
MVVNYSDQNKRRFDCYSGEQEAIEAATKLARQMSERDVLSASMTREQSLEYAAAVQALSPYGVSVADAVSKVAECLKELGNLPALSVAVQFYRQHHRETIKKPVAEVAAEFIKLKESRGASAEYLKDLRYRLNKFTGDCHKAACDVTTADVQDWLDGVNLSSQSYRNFRTVLYTLFHHAETRGYASGNPVEGVEQIKVNRGDIQIFTPLEIRRLLAAAPPRFVPSLSLGAFAGLRTAEIIRLDWQDIDLPGRHIVIGASRAKTGTRRVVPVSENLAEWLSPYAKAKGKVWNWPAFTIYRAQGETAAATEVKADAEKGIRAQPAIDWKPNALRHSYASYRFSVLGDAGRVAGEMGNSPAMVFRHYRELVKPDAAKVWFDVRPESADNVLPMPAAVSV